MTFNKTAYYRNKYQTDEAFKKQSKLNARKYQRSKKGRAVMAKWRKSEKGCISISKSREKFVKSGYYKRYFKKKRMLAKEHNLCVICLSRERYKKFCLCRKCLNRSRKYQKEWRNRKC